jgi:hypothetical protein
MDEKTLEASLELYKSQLSQVEQTIQTTELAENSDLLQLRDDLKELVSLTEEGLLSLKKSNILKGLEGNDRNKTTTEDEEYAAFQACIAEENNSVTVSKTDNPDGDRPALTTALPNYPKDLGENADTAFNISNCSASTTAKTKSHDIGDISEKLSDIVGTLCRAPYVHEWGSSSYHSAMVTDIEMSDDNDFVVSVLFCNPTHEGMLPCEYHIEGKCKFTSDQCRFSHGHSVKLDDLREYTEPNYSSLKMESPCLALFTDGLWYRAMIVDILEDHQYTVAYDNYNETATLDMKDVLPLHSVDNDSSDDEEEGNDGYSMLELDDSSESSSEEEIVSRYFMHPNQTTEVLGVWEEHTRGIGSKLMAKMGYITGQGLGKLSQGRSEPVPIQLIPQGKSLDKIMELKEKAGDRDIFNVSKKMGKKKHVKKTKESSQKSSSDVFHFINRKLGGKKGNIKELVHHQNQKAKHAPVRIHEKELSSRSDRNLNVQLLKTEEEIRKTENELVKLNQALKRHDKKDEGMAKQYRAKIVKTERYLQELKASERTIENHKTKRGHHKKLAIF